MYSVTVKIFEPLGRDELPFIAPLEMERHNKSKEGDMALPLENTVITPGYHVLAVDWNDNELSEFYQWCQDRGSKIKIIGSELVIK